MPSSIRTADEIIPHTETGMNLSSTSAKHTDSVRKAVPTVLITAAERKGNFIPALPSPIADAKPSVETASISRIILSIYITPFIVIIR